MLIMLVGITRYLSYYLTFHVICFDHHQQRTRILSYMIVACHIWHATKIWQFFIVRFNIQTLNMASHFDFSVTFYMRYYLPRTWIIVCLVHESLSASYMNHCLPRTWIIVCLVHESLSASSSSARGTTREGEKLKIRREAPGRMRIQNGGSVFCIIAIVVQMTLLSPKYGLPKLFGVQ
jgi:hypothetical protein